MTSVSRPSLDTVIIGAGPNGLTTAAYLVRVGNFAAGRISVTRASADSVAMDEKERRCPCEARELEEVSQTPFFTERMTGDPQITKSKLPNYQSSHELPIAIPAINTSTPPTTT